MLTKDLLLFRVRRGQVYPAFVDVADADLLAAADSLIALASTAAGTERGELEEQAKERSAGLSQPKIGAGLAKLTFDRMTFEEPSPEAAVARQQSFDIAARTLRALPDDATPESFEQALIAAMPRSIVEVRDSIYADHPDKRRLVEWDPIDARGLLERYNLAQVQGLILRAKGVSLRAASPDVLRVRRLLRWLKFWRLVADVQATEPDLVMEVEGPGAVLDMEKKYGLQLAQFVAMVPSLERYEIRAEITFGTRPSALLIIDESSQLVAPHQQAVGYVPPEIAVILRKLTDGPWEIDPNPAPRPVGASGLCVPDVLFKVGERSVAVEFFHSWHKHSLARRLADLRTRPDVSLVLGVDEKLLKDDELRAAAEGHSQVFLFKGFPSERGLRKLLTDRLGG